MANSTHKMEGYKRYNFNSKGECFNAITQEPLSVQKWSSGREYFRLVNDEGKRKVMYVENVIKHCKDVETEQKNNAKKESKLKEAGFENPTSIKTKTKPTEQIKEKPKKSKRNKFSKEQVLQMHQMKKDGSTIKSIADSYGINYGSMGNILTGTRYPEYKKMFDEENTAN